MVSLLAVRTGDPFVRKVMPKEEVRLAAVFRCPQVCASSQNREPPPGSLLGRLLCRRGRPVPLVMPSVVITGSYPLSSRDGLS